MENFNQVFEKMQVFSSRIADLHKFHLLEMGSQTT